MRETFQLQQKIAELSEKIKIVCEHYRNLKQLLAEKEKQICVLKVSNVELQNQLSLEKNKCTSSPYEKLRVQKEKSFKLSQLPDKYKYDRLASWVSPPKTEGFIKSQESVQQKRIQTSFFENQLQELKDRNNSISSRKVFEGSKVLNVEKEDVSKSKEVDETQSMILKEIWRERDREIGRMNELFQSLNKRIAEAND